MYVYIIILLTNKMYSYAIFIKTLYNIMKPCNTIYGFSISVNFSRFWNILAIMGLMITYREELIKNKAEKIE